METNLSELKEEDLSMESEIIEDKNTLVVGKNENDSDEKDVKLIEENDNIESNEHLDDKENLFACNVCEKSFSTSDKLNEHVSLHFERPFKEKG